MSDDKQIDNGGPAFPHTYAGGEYLTDYGMSLRDYFAAKAMHAILVDPETSSANTPEENDEIAELVAKCAYKMADMMLKERSKP